jgi:hypothetical protein
VTNAVISGVPKIDTATSHNLSIFTAPFSCRILSVSLVADRTPVGGSDANNYVKATVRKRNPDQTLTDIVTKSTTGEEWELRVPWNFDMMTWDEAARTFDADDMLFITFDTAGTGLTRYPMNVTVRYQPL